MNFLSQIEKSRIILLELLELRGYNFDKYNNFEVNEVNIMLKNMDKKITTDIVGLDMVCEHNELEKKI